jgi:hypothetical protein
VKRIIRDIHGRYGLEQEFRGLHPSKQVEIYEEWIYQVSEQMGIKYEKFEPVDLVDCVNHLPYYFNNDKGDKNETG